MKNKIIIKKVTITSTFIYTVTLDIFFCFRNDFIRACMITFDVVGRKVNCENITAIIRIRDEIIRLKNA